MNSVLSLKYSKLFDKNIKILYDNHSDPWFLASDVGQILKYRSVHKIIKEKIPKTNIKFSNSKLFINEVALYTLIINSNLHEAKLFTNWIKEHVIPKVVFTQIDSRDLLK
nr:MAG: anti-repressor protein-like protein [Diabrotica toursvirus 3a]